MTKRGKGEELRDTFITDLSMKKKYSEHLSLSLSLSEELSIKKNSSEHFSLSRARAFVCVCVCMCVRERERERGLIIRDGKLSLVSKHGTKRPQKP